MVILGSPTLHGISAPKGTPREVVDAIYAAARKATEKNNDQIAGNLAVLGADISLLGPDEYAAYLRGRNDLFASGIKTLSTRRLGD